MRKLAVGCDQTSAIRRRSTETNVSVEKRVGKSHRIVKPPAAQLSISPQKFKWFNRNEHDAELNRARVKKCAARKKHKNPITNRLDPVAVIKAELPYSIRKKIDAAAFKILEANPRHPNGRKITFEEARALAIADSVSKNNV